MTPVKSPSLAVGIAASFCLAIFTCFISNNLHPRFEHREETIQQQLRILEGKDYIIEGRPIYIHEFQNRVIPGLVLKAATRVGVLRIGQWYLVLRFTSGFLAFFLLYLLLTKTAKVQEKTAVVAVALLAYAKVYGYNHGWEHPTDFPDIIFMTGFLWATLRHRPLAITGLTLMACFNRESSAFAGVIWFFFYGLSDKGKLKPREATFGIGLTLMALVTVYGIRFYFGGPRSLAPETKGIFGIYEMVSSSLKNPLSGWITLLFCMALPYFVWIKSNWATMPSDWKRLTIGGVVVAAILGSVSLIQELRTFLPALTILTLVAAKAESCASERRPHQWEELHQYRPEEKVQ